MSKSDSMHDSVVVGDPLAINQTLADTPLAKFFKAAVKFESSDLIMRGGQAPKLRLRGELKALDTRAPSIEEFNQWIHDGLTPEQIQQYADKGSLDIGCDFDVDGESHRFRVNIFLTRGRSAIAARRVSNEILNFKDLHLPEVMNRIVEARQGLVLLCGVTGSGKSTTIAAMLDHINQTRACHILTIEDPIEYLFEDKKAMINQREIGLDVPDFPTALRGMVRENPDVVLIGEMRGQGNLRGRRCRRLRPATSCSGTIHASSASQAFNRIYDLFEHEERRKRSATSSPTRCRRSSIRNSCRQSARTWPGSPRSRSCSCPRRSAS